VGEREGGGGHQRGQEIWLPCEQIPDIHGFLSSTGEKGRGLGFAKKTSKKPSPSAFDQFVKGGRKGWGRKAERDREKIDVHEVGSSFPGSNGGEKERKEKGASRGCQKEKGATCSNEKCRNQAKQAKKSKSGN